VANEIDLIIGFIADVKHCSTPFVPILLRMCGGFFGGAYPAYVAMLSACITCSVLMPAFAPMVATTVTA
jgi:hypothetical protein